MRWSMLKICLLIGCIFFTLVSGVSAALSNPTYTEEQVKAVFLLNVTRFVTWPEGGRNYQEKPFTFCVVGNKHFADEMALVLKGELIFATQPNVVASDIPENIPPCDLLYIDKSVERDVWQILDKIKGLPVLSVGDHSKFCSSGGGVALLLKESRIKVQINVEAVRRQRLQVSSKLLRIATVVETLSGHGAK